MVVKHNDYSVIKKEGQVTAVQPAEPREWLYPLWSTPLTTLHQDPACMSDVFYEGGRAGVC